MRIDRVSFVVALTKNDMTLKQLGEKSGLSRSTLTAIKSGKSCSATTGAKLVSVLGPEILDKQPTPPT